MKAFRILNVIVILAMLLSACGTQDTPEPTTAPTEEAAAPTKAPPPEELKEVTLLLPWLLLQWRQDRIP